MTRIRKSSIDLVVATTLLFAGGCSRSEFQAPCCSKSSRLYARPSSDH